jgi:hypothetical protein
MIANLFIVLTDFVFDAILYSSSLVCQFLDLISVYVLLKGTLVVCLTCGDAGIDQ